jgi:hypothetical protein
VAVAGERHQRLEQQQQAAGAPVASQELPSVVVQEPWRSLAKSPVQRPVQSHRGSHSGLALEQASNFCIRPEIGPLKELSLLQQRSISRALFSPVTGIWFEVIYWID